MVSEGTINTYSHCLIILTFLENYGSRSADLNP
jgi:hypothetical protein